MPGKSRDYAAASVRAIAGLLAPAIVLAAASGCTPQAQQFVNKIRAESAEKCNEGNQAACHTIVQALSDTKVAIESTAPLETQTPACNAGKQDACQQLAVLHGELSSWCSTGNDPACAAVNTGPWPAKWDEPALIGAAKLACLSGQFKPDSNTCQALQTM
ncbi:hypothetical protein [Candidatus Binatus sp.]|uniref:hypothetical protein n=1 Tax=Candidatus Binatus sp. TaxID=2811406 RepID=UPI002F93F833